MGQPDDIAELPGQFQSGSFLFQHFVFVFMFPIQRYLQSQLKNMVIAWLSVASLVLHIALSWHFIVKLEMGLVGAAITLALAWWVPAIGQFLEVAPIRGSGCREMHSETCGLFSSSLSHRV